MMQNLVKIQKIFDIESINPDVFNTLNTMFENNAIEYDVKTNILTVNVDIVLKFKENIQIDCDKHILLSSGQKIDPESDNETPYAIWLNPEKDDDGNPITKLEMPEDG